MKQQSSLKTEWLDKENQAQLGLWRKLVDGCPYGDILQYPEWGMIKQGEGWGWQIAVVYQKDIWKKNVEDSWQMVAGLMILSKKVGLGPFSLGNYGYAPHGPVWNSAYDLQDWLPTLVDFLKAESGKKGWITLEIEPKFGQIVGKIVKNEIEAKNNPKDNSNSSPKENSNSSPNSNLTPFVAGLEKELEKAGFVTTGRNMQPKYKLLYDLEKTEAELLSLCNKSTRYNIKLAQKKGVVVKEYLPGCNQMPEKLAKFYELLLETQQRAKGYPIRSLASFEKMMKVFEDLNSKNKIPSLTQNLENTKSNISLFEASYEGQTIAINISQRTGYWASSFYASSNRLFPELKAPYLLRWTSILKAKEEGCKVYDFWGIIPAEVGTAGQHKGYSDHKLGFGGTRIDHIGLQALVFMPFKNQVWNFLVHSRTSLAIWLRR